MKRTHRQQGQLPQQATVQDLAHQLGIRCICPSSKSQQELLAWYPAADVFALSSSEPWGLVVQETILSPLSVVVSWDVGYHLDLVHDDTRGWTFERGDIAELAAGLERFLASAGRLAKAEFAMASGWHAVRANTPFAETLHVAGKGQV